MAESNDENATKPDVYEIITLDDSPVKTEVSLLATPSASIDGGVSPAATESPLNQTANAAKAKSKSSFMVNGVDVEFPADVKPYRTQVTIMDRVLRAVNQQENALIECPTGSGKTLALLTAVLAWQKKEAERLLQESKAPPAGGGCTVSNGNTNDDASCCSHSTPATEHTPSSFAHEKAISGDGDVATPKGRRVTVEEEDDDEFEVPGRSRRKRVKADTATSTESDVNGRTDTVDGGKTGTSSKKSDCSFCCPEKPSADTTRRPRIYYGTRTHRQIAHLVKELRRTPYRSIPYTILASREVTCQHPDVMGKPDKVTVCKSMINQEDGYSSCSLYASLKRSYDTPAEVRAVIASATQLSLDPKGGKRAPKGGRRGDAPKGGVWDIEDMVGYAQTQPAPFCAYFAVTRVLLKDAQLILCPYNYIVDPVVRQAMQLSIGVNDVVILDEAHNMEDTCRDSASQVFTTEQVAAAIDNVRTTQQLYMNMPGKRAAEARELLPHCAYVLRVLQSLREFIAELHKHCTASPAADSNAAVTSSPSSAAASTSFRSPMSSPFVGGGKGRPSNVLEGPDIHVRLRQYSFLCRARSAETQKCLGDLAAVNDGENSKIGMQPLPKLAAATFVILEKWLFFIHFFDNNEQDFRAFTEEGDANQRRVKPEVSVDENNWLSKPLRSWMQPAGKDITLNLWCMNPALVFVDSFARARSVILASGTLSPIATLTSELGVHFRFTMQGMHVVPPDRVFAATLATGPAGTPLRATYGNTEQAAFQADLGALVLTVCRTVPNGVLCFLPSYRLLNTLVDAWHANGVYRQLEEVKTVLEEPKDGRSLASVMTDFLSAIGSGRGGGALLLAVHRGKVSEGLDFTDDSARAVISVGIPYPNVKDIKVGEKRRYNDRFSKTRGLLSGEQWYETQAYRALNQSLGRCLRHQHDWGALVLVDARFCGVTHQRYCAHVSRWIRAGLRDYARFDDFRGELEAFVRRLTEGGQKEAGEALATHVAKKPMVI